MSNGRSPKILWFVNRIDPWSDKVLLNERVSDHPPRNRWLLAEVNSGKVHDLGSSARWVFFLKEDVVARALELAP